VKMKMKVEVEFDELWSKFEVVRKRFQDAETFEEKLQLVAMSKQIVREGRDKLADRKRLKDVLSKL
jgi:hypothetical protein